MNTKMIRKTLVAIALLFPLIASAQSVKDTSLQLHMFSFHVNGNLPGGDLAERYGANAGVGANYWFKTRSNWIFKGEFTYYSSQNFKEDTIFRLIMDSHDNFTNINGEYSELSAYMRGYYAGLKVGRLFPVFGPNPNSGLMVTASAGFMEYKTYLYQELKDVPLLNGEYQKGWDQLSNGFAMNQFIGYLHLDSHQPINFYVGFDFHQIWATNRRDWNFAMMGPDHTLRKDLMFGIRFGWIFPVNKKVSDTYYFY